MFPEPEKLQTEPEELQENPEEPKSITESGTVDGISDTNDPLYNEELNRELEDLDTFGERRDTGFEQMSLFPFQGSVLTEKEKQDIKEGKYTCLNPKIEDSVPHDYIVSVLKRGTGFVDGKKRVYNIIQTEPAKSERVRQIRSEFGLGGAGWPLEGYGLHGYDTFKTSKGMRFQWRDEEGEKEGYMEQKRLGLANKTVMVVPKPLIGQTASEFLRLYPSANILVATENDFAKKKRQQFVARIATGDYDCIIMSHSQFEKIPVSKERQQELLDRQIEEITFAIEEMKEADGERWSVKQMEAARKRLEEQLKELTDAPKDDLITFEELGIDSIMVDEAHAFKNMSIFSKMTNVAGITGGGSKRAKEKMEIDNDVQRLKVLKAAYDRNHYRNQDDFTVRYAKLIKAAEEKLSCVKADVIYRDEMAEKETAFSITVGATLYDERVDGGTALIAAIAKAKTGVTTELGTYKGFTLSVEKNFMGVNYLILSGKTGYSVETSTSPVGLMMRLENTFNSIQEKGVFLQQKLEEYIRSMEQAKEDYKKPFEHEEELKEKLARQYEINTALDLDKDRGEEPVQEESKGIRVAERGTGYPNR